MGGGLQLLNKATVPFGQMNISQQRDVAVETKEYPTEGASHNDEGKGDCSCAHPSIAILVDGLVLTVTHQHSDLKCHKTYQLEQLQIVKGFVGIVVELLADEPDEVHGEHSQKQHQADIRILHYHSQEYN